MTEKQLALLIEVASILLDYKTFDSNRLRQAIDAVKLERQPIIIDVIDPTCLCGHGLVAHGEIAGHCVMCSCEGFSL